MEAAMEAAGVSGVDGGKFIDIQEFNRKRGLGERNHRSEPTRTSTSTRSNVAHSWELGDCGVLLETAAPTPALANDELVAAADVEAAEPAADAVAAANVVAGGVQAGRVASSSRPLNGESKRAGSPRFQGTMI
jgi:hypothetical protein